MSERKLLYREGSANEDFYEFPVPVQKDLGVALIKKRLKAVLAPHRASPRT